MEHVYSCILHKGEFSTQSLIIVSYIGSASYVLLIFCAIQALLFMQTKYILLL